MNVTKLKPNFAKIKIEDKNGDKFKYGEKEWQWHGIGQCVKKEKSVKM